MANRDDESSLTIGRYRLSKKIASGGMASVRLGRLVGEVFSRVVAIKQMHPHLVNDPEFVAMFIDEARLSAHVHHPNVVATLDVISQDGELFVVMEYVHGETLASLLRTLRETGEAVPLPIAARIAYDMLSGLHAAHDAVGENGEPLGIVHRDVSPHNVIVGTDGVSRLIDFGIAKAVSRLQTTREGQIKGKLAYMAPEQLRSEAVDRRTDVYAAAVVLWELLTRKRLFLGDSDGETMGRLLAAEVAPPSTVDPAIPVKLDAVVLRGLDRRPDHRFATAREMADALRAACDQAAAGEVAEWVERHVGDKLQSRAREIEADARVAREAETVSTVAPNPDGRVRLDSAVAEVTVASPASVPRRRRRHDLVPWGALTAVVAVVIAGTATLLRARPPAAAATVTASASVETSASTSPPGAASAVDPPPPPPPAVLPSTTPLVATSAIKPLPRNRPASPPLGANCNPPYTVDAIGVRKYKRECVTNRN
ncbi:MAG: serine/threonine-protein kinase [Minicystis sp.]